MDVAAGRGEAAGAVSGSVPPPGPAAPGGARAYHDETKHSPASVRSDRHTLDWANKPSLFKEYPGAPVVALPRDVVAPAAPALRAVARGAAPDGQGPVDAAALAALLFFSAGLTKRLAYPGGEGVHFRAAPSTGALYQTEVYVLAGAVAGVEPGVYHFGPEDFALRRLRAGDYRRALADVTGESARVGDAPASLVLSAIYWRNAWKYRARAFRHLFWDAGTMLANLLATAVALDVPARVLLAFADPVVNGLLGLDAAREGSLAIVPLGCGAGPAPPSPPAPPLGLRTAPLSAREVDYPLVRAAYAASSLADGPAARAWLEAGEWPAAAPGAARPPAEPAPASRPLGETILRRGSTREFARAPLAARALAPVLEAAFRPLPMDVADGAPPLVRPYLLLHAVEGLASGAYAWSPEHGALRLLRAGDFRREGAELCLDQPLGGDASAVAFFLADLGAALARWGNRGYRAVNLAAGLLGGRLYLGAYGLGFGATGLTFYDDDVVRFFEPDAAGLDAIFVTALGRAAPPRRGGLRLAPAVRLEPRGPGAA
jgi:SagB-type dehydrogenase family enzyme